MNPKPPQTNYKAFLVQDSSGAIYFTQRKPKSGKTAPKYIAVDLILLRNELHSFISGVKKNIREQQFTREFKARWSKGQ